MKVRGMIAVRTFGAVGRLPRRGQSEEARMLA